MIKKISDLNASSITVRNYAKQAKIHSSPYGKMFEKKVVLYLMRAMFCYKENHFYALATKYFLLYACVTRMHNLGQ